MGVGRLVPEDHAMSDVIDLASERKKREPAPLLADVQPVAENGLVELEITLPPECAEWVRNGQTMQVGYTSAEARVLANALFRKALEAEIQARKKP